MSFYTCYITYVKITLITQLNLVMNGSETFSPNQANEDKSTYWNPRTPGILWYLENILSE